jgi:hypothetical protein
MRLSYNATRKLNFHSKRVTGSPFHSPLLASKLQENTCISFVGQVLDQEKVPIKFTYQF